MDKRTQAFRDEATELIEAASRYAVTARASDIVERAFIKGLPPQDPAADFRRIVGKSGLNLLLPHSSRLKNAVGFVDGRAKQGIETFSHVPADELYQQPPVAQALHPLVANNLATLRTNFTRTFEHARSEIRSGANPVWAAGFNAVVRHRRNMLKVVVDAPSSGENYVHPDLAGPFRSLEDDGLPEWDLGAAVNVLALAGVEPNLVLGGQIESSGNRPGLIS